MRALSFAALIVGVILIPTGLGLAGMDHDRELSQLERTLVAETDEHGAALDNYFTRVRERAGRARHARRQGPPAGPPHRRGDPSPPLPRAAVSEQRRRGVLH